MKFKGRLLGPYQHAGVEWMRIRELSEDAPGGILADEMGLGKTIMTLAAMSRNPLESTLIVVPSMLVHQWVDAIRDVTDAEPTVLSAKFVKECEHPLGAGVYVSTYGAFARDAVLSASRFDRIVLDEAQYVKNSRGKTHANLAAVDARIKWCLTGTPIAKNAGDFKALLSFLGIYGQSDLRILAARYVLRRTKEDICKHSERLRLPPLSIRLVESDFRYDHEREAYEDICAWGRTILGAYATAKTREGRVEILKQLLRLRQCATNADLFDADETKGQCTKIDMLCEEIAKHPRGEKTIVFCHWIREMTAVQEALAFRLGLRSVRLDGRTQDRDAVIRAFNEDPKVPIIVVQIECGGVGLNLQTATRVYINSSAWNASTELQAIGRAHRTGQTRMVHVKRLVVRGTIDEYVLDLQQHKLDIAAEVLSDPRISFTLATKDRQRRPFIEFLNRIFDVKST